MSGSERGKRRGKGEREMEKAKRSSRMDGELRMVKLDAAAGRKRDERH